VTEKLVASTVMMIKVFYNTCTGVYSETRQLRNNNAPKITYEEAQVLM